MVVDFDTNKINQFSLFLHTNLLKTLYNSFIEVQLVAHGAVSNRTLGAVIHIVNALY